ncbi:zinc finger C2HC domain-containing protein 1C-like [Betta splendens]|uniref:Zinc finger C2HC domain-containing protein 1C-like n=1 Tax=Betta splendens TaxID=158456 RepID=A0A6P7LPS0_BETSP|nr:zinc finger C2HC domain-containing protein 1C-like [Betta splendens]XP_028995994.1 zinc finger C2HC domain-containing protein 1C-like [Betta splendens]
MSTDTSNELGPQKPHNVEVEEPGDVNNPAQCRRREAEAERRWPKKPVIHRRRSDTRTQGSMDTYDFEKMTISKQTEGLLSQGKKSETRKIHGLNHPSKDLLAQQREVEMNRLIHAKKLMLLETLLNLEVKVRQKLQSVEASAGDDWKHREQSHNRAVWPQTTLSEQRRRQEGGQHLRERQRPSDERRTRDTWRLGVRPEHRREVNEASTGTKYKAKEMHRTENEHETPQWTPHKPAALRSTDNHRAAEGKTKVFPPISTPSSSSSSQQHEVGLARSTDASFHLLPCRICNRKFMSARLEKHVQICEKVKQPRRRVFNSYINRTKGSAIEEFCKTHSRSKIPDV